jgi:hypothetical protein
MKYHVGYGTWKKPYSLRVGLYLAWDNAARFNNVIQF